MTNVHRSTIAFEAGMAWMLCRDLRHALEAGDYDTAWSCIEELEGVAKCTDQPRLRQLAESTITSIALRYLTPETVAANA